MSDTGDKLHTHAVQRMFESMGSRLVVLKAPSIPSSRSFTIDVAEGPRGEQFVLTLSQTVRRIQVLEVRPSDRHLLMLIDSERDQKPGREKLLCGFDERHLFVAAVPLSASTVEGAKQALKPEPVVESQRRKRVKHRDRHRRKNAGFVRQGEWFFVPVSVEFVPDDRMVLRNEPIRRGAGKPHIVEEVFRRGGDTVYVCPRYPEGLSTQEYRDLVQRDSSTRGLPWTTMKRNPEVLAKGRVRHPDHKTIRLRTWHRVFMNNEVVSKRVAFLD